ncbi:MAG: hypothetical protein HFJ17_05230 [Clostridia bacterium]|nr:hypothetical protein [Clostridia bacterium]
MMNFINKIKSLFENIDKKDLKIMCNGLKFCFFILLFSIGMLLTYLLFTKNVFTYQIGILVFQLSLYFAIDFIVAGIVVDRIQREIL